MDDETVAQIMERTQHLIEEGTRREPAEDIEQNA
jgi:hypothetical protein